MKTKPSASAPPIHFAHGIQHDILQLEPLSDHRDIDARTDEKYLEMIRNPPMTEPHMELSARTMLQLCRAIDWTLSSLPAGIVSH